MGDKSQDSVPDEKNSPIRKTFLYQSAMRNGMLQQRPYMDGIASIKQDISCKLSHTMQIQR